MSLQRYGINVDNTERLSLAQEEILYKNAVAQNKSHTGYFYSGKRRFRYVGSL